MEKRITKDGTHEFYATKKANQAGTYESMVIEEGVRYYIMMDGKKVLADKWDELWGIKKGVIDWKAKGDNPDKTKDWRK